LKQRRYRNGFWRQLRLWRKKKGISMFKKLFLATTALVLAASVALAARERGTPNSRVRPGYLPAPVSASLLVGKTNNHGMVRNNTPHDASGVIFSNFSKDKNAEFISWYGFTAINSTYSYYYSQSYHYKITTVGFNAIPLTGTGKAPKSMTIPIVSDDPSAYEFEGVIMNSAGGLPGNVIATTSATTWSDTLLCCTAARMVYFSGAPKLENGKQYFVGSSVRTNRARGAGIWKTWTSRAPRKITGTTI
jgi:hypothetical protein